NGAGTVLAQVSKPSGPSALVYPNAAAGAYTVRALARSGTATIALDWAYPAQEVRTKTYDTGGRVIAQTDGAGTTTYSYDTADRLTAVHFPDGTSRTYTYLAGGQLKTVVDGGGAMAYSYDHAGRLATAVDTSGVET